MPDNYRNKENGASPLGEDCPVIETAADMMRCLESIEELPTLSSVAMRVNAMLQNMDATARDIAEVIERDQSMVCKLLKLANSSFFGFSSRVSNIAHAVMILGFNTVYNAVLSMAVIDALGVRNKFNGLDMSAFWRHSISVAVVSRHLSGEIKGQQRENAFTAGILHDVGKVVMARFFTDRFLPLWQKVANRETSYVGAERQYFPMGHDAIGAFLTRCWNIPEELTVVVAQHHHPEILPRPNILALIVNAADSIVNLHLENNQPEDQWPVCPAARQLLGEKIHAVDEWLPDVTEDIKAAWQSILE